MIRQNELRKRTKTGVNPVFLFTSPGTGFLGRHGTYTRFDIGLDLFFYLLCIGPRMAWFQH